VTPDAKKVLFIFGTRPEAIKLCPVIRHLRSRPDKFDVRVCVTGQHREMLDLVLGAFDVKPDRDLDVMAPGQTLYQSTSRILAGLEPVLVAERPDMILVQGDTTSTLCGAMAGFYSRIPVGHVEAGLRTGDLMAPFPEEMNRVVTTRLATLHFAPTESSAANLLNESVPRDRISVTGNPGIDAVLYVRGRLERGELAGGSWPRFDAARRIVAVTAHRRESFGEGFERICRALLRLSRRSDVQIVFPVHPNPNVQGPVNRYLKDVPNILLTEPLEYVQFVDLMRRAHFLITDSGGVQEEGPSLGKPVLVMRDKTERPEAVEAGTAIIVGTEEDRIFSAAVRLLEDRAAYDRMARTHNPYGDGNASERIAGLILSHHSLF
jgi:UDP-N-acetylglucosamine 2-epimerase (non-hydrolysing)